MEYTNGFWVIKRGVYVMHDVTIDDAKQYCDDQAEIGTVCYVVDQNDLIVYKSPQFWEEDETF